MWREDWWNAAENGKVAVVRTFIEVGGEGLDEKAGDGYTALIYVAFYGHLEVVTVLVQAGAGVDVAENCGWTPLHIAAMQGHLEVRKYLVEDGKSASVN